jgi:CBS domain-containing protein
MLVKHILRDKGREVVSISPGTTLADAARLLAAKRIGALVVRDSGGPIAGILSERDIVWALATDSVEALAHTVSAHMTSEVETCSETDTVEALMETMTHQRLRHLPVVEGGRVAGIVSIGDVVKTRIAETVREAEDLRGYIGAG